MCIPPGTWHVRAILAQSEDADDGEKGSEWADFTH